MRKHHADIEKPAESCDKFRWKFILQSYRMPGVLVASVNPRTLNVV